MNFHWVMLAAPARRHWRARYDRDLDPALPGAGQRARRRVHRIGEIPSGIYPERGFMAQIVEASARAIQDASCAHTDIDQIVLIPCLHGIPDQADLIFSRVAEELGLHGKVKSSVMVHSGGSTSDNATRMAAGLIASGQARNVLVVYSENAGAPPTCRR